MIKGIALSAVALYLLQLSEHHLRRAVEYVVIVLMVATISIVIFNLYKVGYLELINNHGFEFFVNRNSLAVGFSITAIFLFSLMVGEQSRWKTLLWSGCCMCVSLAAFLNGSRGAIVGMFAALTCMTLTALVRVGWRRIFRLDLWIFPFLIISVIVGWILYKNIILATFFIHGDKGVDTGRFEIWKAVSERVVHAPWFGYGSHAMKFDPMLAAVRAEHAVSYPHNIYIGLVYASEVVGILFWLIWFISFSFKIKNNFERKNDLSYYLGIGLLTNILVHGLVDFDFYKFATITFLVFGVVMIIPRTTINKEVL